MVRGVKPNDKKSIDGALGEEIQGYYVHPHGHWVGFLVKNVVTCFRLPSMFYSNDEFSLVWWSDSLVNMDLLNQLGRA